VNEKYVAASSTAATATRVRRPELATSELGESGDESLEEEPTEVAGTMLSAATAPTLATLHRSSSAAVPTKAVLGQARRPWVEQRAITDIHGCS
jgi:hypothetical protein